MNNNNLNSQSDSESKYLSAVNETPRSPSSTSITSEGTLNDDSTLMSEAIIPQKQKVDVDAYIDQLNHNRDHSRDGSCNENIVNINTDYESSAPEDLESFTDSARYENTEWALLSYSRTNKLDKLRALLEAKSRGDISLNLNYKGQQKKNYSWSALHLACYFGHIAVVELLLSNDKFRKEINLNIQNNSGDTPLHKATFTNRIEIVQLLLSQGANVFIENCDAQLARQLTNNKDILQMLQAAEQNDRNRIKSNLFKAVDNGDLKTLQDYIKTYSSFQITTHEDAPDRLDDVPSSSNNPEDEEAIANENNLKKSDEPLNEMIDERGNTLLHLGAMRGFKAICVYLLEQGLDPFKKNNLGQTCFDLSSNQLKQLFTQVKPSSDQLQRLTKQRVSRFEGPLLKKVRILGWKPIYVVLENGVILLFNNKRDSMNKARRGYKYLESATCELAREEVGMFTICFSDRSKATFAISSENIEYYSTLNRIHQTGNQKTTSGSRNHIELIRQRWYDALIDHIQYSTNFIRRGLKFNDQDDDDIYPDSGNTSLEHKFLLPVDTMKSFVQESRAHYSILERHADLLHNLVQQINLNTIDRYSQSIDVIDDDEISSAQMLLATGTQPLSSNPTQVNYDRVLDTQQVARSSNILTPSNPVRSSTSRLFGFIKPSPNKQQAQNHLKSSPKSVSKGLDIKRLQNSPGSRSSTNRRRATSTTSADLTNDFLSNDWHCVLFHLKLLLESAQNTKDSMGHTISLIENQEHLRQTRLQELEERCRLLENSLHALARDHHELEKSISSLNRQQIYQSNPVRSISMSTDLNEYFDAFEDFDDKKTLTPSDSIPSDEDLNKRIQEIIDDEDSNNRHATTSSAASRLFSLAGKLVNSGGPSNNGKRSSDDSVDQDDEEDLQSNCSALTVETISEISPGYNQAISSTMQDDNCRSAADRAHGKKMFSSLKWIERIDGVCWMSTAIPSLLL